MVMYHLFPVKSRFFRISPEIVKIPKTLKFLFKVFNIEVVKVSNFFIFKRKNNVFHNDF